MGLDIYLYRLRKANKLEEGKQYTREELMNLAPNACTLTEDDEGYKCPSIQSVGTKITVIEKMYDAKKIAEKFDIPGCTKLRTIGESLGDHHSITFSLYNDSDEEVGSCTVTDDIEADVLVDCPVDYLVFEEEEVDYQRKGLNDEGWELMPENCVHDDDKERVEKMVKYGGLSETFLDNWVDGETCLLCWW